MANFNGKFESTLQDWETPTPLFNYLNDLFLFDIDLAASDQNKKCSVFFSESDDSMKQEWKGHCWLNPPYGSKGHKLKDWVIKAWNESRKKNCTVVLLIPTRTNTEWWHDYCMKACEICFIRGRPRFNNSTHGLPQPLAIIVFKNDNAPTILKSIDMKQVLFLEHQRTHEK